MEEWLGHARRMAAAGIVVTEKDAVKLETLAPPPADSPPLWALRAEFRVVEGEAELWSRIEPVLKGAPSP